MYRINVNKRETEFIHQFIGKKKRSRLQCTHRESIKLFRNPISTKQNEASSIKN